MTEAYHLIDQDGDVWASEDSPEDGYSLQPPGSGIAVRSLEYVAVLYGIDAGRRPSRRLPDATADGYDWPALPCDAGCASRGDHREAGCYVPADQPTVLAEAEAAVYGDREADYGHPREDFTRQAILWTGLLQHKLADGAWIEAEDIARCMVAVKLARDVHSPKRDNRVDGAGYFLTLDRLETGK